MLVNDAGMMLLSPIERARVEDWRRMLDLNLLGLMVATRAALPHMRRQKDGHVVNISSTAGRVANPDASVYAATKFGVGAFSRRSGARCTGTTSGSRHRAGGGGHGAEGARARPGHAGAHRHLGPLDAPAAERGRGRAILYAVSQPPHVNVNEILLRPTDQERWAPSVSAAQRSS